MIRKLSFLLPGIVVAVNLFAFSGRVIGQSQPADIVIYAAQAPVTVGNWVVVSDSNAAGGYRLFNPDANVPKISTAAANPTDYFEITFTATAGKPYQLWMRSRAQSDSPYNDSVHVQFSGSVDSAGNPVFRIGTTSATTMNLEDCFGCGISGWGWQDNGWGVMGKPIYFQSSGTQTIRVQNREDGLSIDQIVLSPANYLYSSPGALRNDNVILQQPPISVPPPTPTPVSAPAPLSTPVPVPPIPIAASATDVVIWASDVASNSIRGNWYKEFSSSAAGQTVIRTPNHGAAKVTDASAPANYFEVNFNAVAGVPYRLWIRGRAEGDFWGNDSVYAQFSSSLDVSGIPAYRIGSPSGLVVNLEDCLGCGIQGWGWQDTGWGLGVLGPAVYFQSTGTQTLRVQTREDGFLIDQILLSPSTYLHKSPGTLRSDSVLLANTVGSPVENKAPQVSISASSAIGLGPLYVSFTANASDPDGYLVNFNWTFGDGNSSTVANPGNTYYSPGTYTARLTVTDNLGATATASTSITVNATPTTAAQLRVLSWNVAFGQGTDGIKDYKRTASYLSLMNPDLAAISEIPPSDVPTLVGYLNQMTGRSWYSHFVPKYEGCLEGNLILSRYSFISVSGFYLSYNRSVAQATVNVGGRSVNFFATHLDDASSTYRAIEVAELANWATNFSEPRIFAGDFNGGPDTPEVGRMLGTYYDSWAQAMGVGLAAAYPDNPVGVHTRTRRGRIDYVFYSVGSVANLVMKGTRIVDTRDLGSGNVVIRLGTLDDKGVRPSDHNPMIADFDLR